jgi:alpha-ketoglutarate-dependent taurine dioxygenase
MTELSVRALHPLFAAEVTGLDLGRPIDAAIRAALVRAMDEHAVLP